MKRGVSFPRARPLNSARYQAFSTVAQCYFSYIIRPDGRKHLNAFSQKGQLFLSEQMANEKFIKIICEVANQKDV